MSGPRLLGAPLTLTSEIGRGSRFAVVLPMSVTQPSAPGRPAKRPVSEPAPVTILIVDDDARVCEAMATMLAARGHRTIIARDAAAALAAAGRYDVALVDFHLGAAEDGLTLIAALPPRPAALVTADPDPLLAQRATAQGVILLAKPLDPSALDAWLAEALGG